MPPDFDLLVIGGGINGTGIANVAAQSGLSVLLVEQNDLAAHTSSRSSKLIHGDLRDLERGALRQVREALAEREVLLSMAPHIVWPLSFVLPLAPDARPAWKVRAGLFIYDHLGPRKGLSGCQQIDLRRHSVGQCLRPTLTHGFSYADCWVDDARLVVLNAMQAEEYGASILPRTRLMSARREEGLWRVELLCADGSQRELCVRGLVNAAGPWAASLAGSVLGSDQENPAGVSWVKGSHIVVPRLYQGDHAYLLQNHDQRLIVVLPYGEFNLIGSAESPYAGEITELTVSHEDIEYLCAAVNRYFQQPLLVTDVVWSFAGVRTVKEDRAKELSTVARDYRLELDAPEGAAPLLSVYGGKMTTYRQLAKCVRAKLASYFPDMTALADPPPTLPGGSLPSHSMQNYLVDLCRRFPFIPVEHLCRMARRHGSRCEILLQGVRSLDDLGLYFGGGLYLREVRLFCADEWAAEAEDVLWRRSKCALTMSASQRLAFTRWWERDRLLRQGS